MKISVITAVYNRADTIAGAIDSVLGQQNVDLEYIVVDGKSTDSTADVVASYGGRITRSICEPDAGIYDALNKGIAAASGDAIGFLHADDCFADDQVLSRVVEMLADERIDGVYGDLVYVDAGSLERVRRKWVSGPYKVAKFRRGWMPPHPTVYFRKQCYEQFGVFNDHMKTAADYELLVRMMVKHQVPMGYLPQVMVKMRVGGASNASLRNRMHANADDRNAWVINGLPSPWGLRLTKPLRKLPQFLR
ncbi:glycosyltransferase family 2 protein [Allorhodopirellula solitaria]|uniref:PGL/p-HBAD biosynthesis glycosyltransferase n=1 Tax=Allorhodopirellula solitaria TaxID=2527987 RepID=A0A5C5YC21_9BACT|nr:glycosyltransferase family 2 protein [Allorhodopirellula solitaria]TWT72930.1 PGL/p-HBAD biosynthesis glycosyltransferase [Allorhodopirellula solitaria]